MSILLQNNFSNTRQHSLALLFFISAVVFADANINLPPDYRTPLPEIVYDNNNEWRAIPDEENPWREEEGKVLFKPRIKAELFPMYHYDKSTEDTNPNVFLNEGTQQERPVTNIFKYTF